MIVIVGAGLAGLVCARVLREAGHAATILERDLVPGGRVRTERHPEGFLLDRGFQVLFTAYPAAHKHLSFARLDLKPFVPGALIARGGKLHAVADPRRAPGYLLPSLTNPLFGLGDKLRVIPTAARARRATLPAIFGVQEDTTTLAYLQQQGFSAGFIDAFMRPFYGGIFLDRSLGTSAAMFRFTFKMLAEGETAIPAQGMQEIPEQLAKALPPDAIRYGVTLAEIVQEEGRVVGVVTATGEEIEADAVVVATDPACAADLLGADAVPHQPVPVTCVYFASPSSFYSDRMIVLNANPDAYVNNLVQLDNIAPSYAPSGQHLLSLTVLGSTDEGSDEEIEQRCRQEMAALFPARADASLRLLRIVRIPFAQFAQPPGVYATLPGNMTAIPNLVLASEVTHSSSIQGAMASGEAAARQLLAGLAPV